ncbi:MAG: hypothetical protein PHW75_02755 [Patescibacteria group bacterium]|nr:hypothetical protein [Patescibacteria group bacterium]
MPMGGSESYRSSEQMRDEVQFPSSFTDTAECDRYFFRYVNDAAKIIVEQNGGDPKDPNQVAKVSIRLNMTYTKTPEVALSNIKDALSNPESMRDSVYMKYDEEWENELDDDAGNPDDPDPDEEYPY